MFPLLGRKIKSDLNDRFCNNKLSENTNKNEIYRKREKKKLIEYKNISMITVYLVTKAYNYVIFC